MKCSYKKKNKESCKNNSLKNDKYCYWHSSKVTEAEKNLNRSNGGKNKIIKCNSDFPEFELNNIADVCNLIASMVNSVLQNKIDLRIATGIGYLLNLQMKAIELVSIESKLFKMEDIIIELPKSFTED
ncbi:MAG: hypothetical protein WAU38_11465 [Ignavibacteria bacterium]